MTENKKGFTLVELMVVMALIAVLSTLIIGAIRLATNTSRETTHRANGRSVQTALESEYAKYRKYCGVTGSKYPTCPSGSVSLSAAGTSLGVEMANGSSTDSVCASGGTTAGGGRAWITQSSYVIKPATGNCTDFTSFQDLIQVGLGTALTQTTWNSSPYNF